MSVEAEVRTEALLRKGSKFIYDSMWAEVEEESPPVIKVGLTEHVAKALGPVEAIKVIPEGRTVERGHPIGSVERGRRIVILRSPVSGVILKVNRRVLEEPEVIYRDPYGEGWIATIRPYNLQEDLKYLRPIHVETSS